MPQLSSFKSSGVRSRASPSSLLRLPLTQLPFFPSEFLEALPQCQSNQHFCQRYVSERCPPSVAHLQSPRGPRTLRRLCNKNNSSRTRKCTRCYVLDGALSLQTCLLTDLAVYHLRRENHVVADPRCPAPHVKCAITIARCHHLASAPTEAAR